MFFTKGLLFWLNKSLSFIPKDINVVLIGASLTEAEACWVRDKLKRPFFCIDIYMDDRDTWDMLFKVNQYDFGWIDIDCFVFNSQLFYEMMKIESSVAMNSVWSWESNLNFEFQSTYFLYVNIAAFREIEAKGIEITPYAYVYQHMGNLNHVGAKIISDKNERLIKKMIESNKYPIRKTSDHGLPFFDTLLVYQIITRVFGYKMNKIRCLNYTNYMSNEIMHIGDSSYFTSLEHKKPKLVGENYKLYLYIAYLIIDSMLDSLPAEYRVQKKIIVLQMQNNHYNKANAKKEIVEYMDRQGINQEVIEKLIYFN